MVKFRCKISGNIISFSHPVDIESTRRHSGYEELRSVEEVIEKAPSDVKVEAPTKKAGRPPKATSTTEE